MKLETLLNVDKIVIQSGKQITITATVPDKKETIDYLAERRGKALSCSLDDVQRELGIENTLVDLRLPEGTIIDASNEPIVGGVIPCEHFTGAKGFSLREQRGYPYLVIACDMEPPHTLDFPALMSWIYENEQKLLALMEQRVEPLAEEEEPEQAELFQKEGFAVKLGVDEGYLVSIQVDDSGDNVEEVIANINPSGATVFESMEKSVEWLSLARQYKKYPDAEIVEAFVGEEEEKAAELPEPGLSSPEDDAEPVEEGGDSGE